jgi:hypothetical protein
MVAAAHATGSRVALPRPGEPFEPTTETVPPTPGGVDRALPEPVRQEGWSHLPGADLAVLRRPVV